MNLPLLVARRYFLAGEAGDARAAAMQPLLRIMWVLLVVCTLGLALVFVRRRRSGPEATHNAVNIITRISITVIAVVTAAMVVVLSTMNGIADLVDSIYSPFDQDITVTPDEGKTFERDAVDLGALLRLPGVAAGSWTIEENVLLRSGGQQAVATLKGVEDAYLGMSRLSDHLYAGRADLGTAAQPLAVMGVGLKLDLDVPLDDGLFQPLEISAPVRGRKLSKYQQAAFETEAVAVAGAFSINTDFDARYVLVPLGLAAELLHYDSAVSSLELQLEPKADRDRVAQAVRDVLGGGYLVRTRHQKNALMYRTNATEKWFTFVVLVFIGLIGAFNIIASLTMLMIGKRRDMVTLESLGATPSMIRRVFLYEGMIIVAIGMVMGLLVGLLVCWAQERYGLIGLTGSVVDSYPVKVLAPDLLLIVCTMAAIGLLATWVPLRSLGRRFLHAGMGPVRA